MTDIEERLRAALSARSELVRSEDLRPLAPVVELRPRGRSPWALLATAAVVVLIVGLVLQGLDPRLRADEVAPRPDRPQLELPPDVGRDWEPSRLSRSPRLDLDGDGAPELVEFLGEPTEDFDGRFRMQTTLSGTGEEVYGIAEVGTTIDTNVLEPIDADADGDQELVLYYDDPDAVGGGGYPLVFDLRDGLLVQAIVEDPELLIRGQVQVPGSRTEFFEMVRIHDYWFEGGRLFSSRSRDTFASGAMTLARTETILVDAWEWRLDADGVLQSRSIGCLRSSFEARTPCGQDEAAELPTITPVATETVGIGEETDFRQAYRFTARLGPAADPGVVVTGDDGRTLSVGLEVDDPRIATVQPVSALSDGASLFVTSASDPSYVAVLGQDGDRLRPMEAVGEIDLLNEDGVRTWLTQSGSVVSVVEGEDGAWQAWLWIGVSLTEMAALPWGAVCFDDIDDPATARSC